ncbi:hypothetical protein [Arthrobacter sp. Ld5]|uniref:hypothetical protein n=1 Tax=Arthrobacter sp. Ld5 TaxID=649152 RepID=UPI003EB9A224
MSEGANPDATDESIPEGLTAEDLRLGKKASRSIDIACVVAFAACVAIAAFVFLNVPWDTRMPYSGRFGRNGIIAPIALFPTLVVLFGFWRSGKKPDAHHMRKGSRVGSYVLGTAIIAACVYFQSIFAGSILEAADYGR